VAVRVIDISNRRLDSRKESRASPLHCLRTCNEAELIFDKSPLPPLAESFTETSQLSMASAKPNYLTAFNAGEAGDKEFIVSCKGRPFSILTASQLPTPNVTYMDFSLVHELNLRMSDYQCRKLLFCGKKLRILGTISTSVQCIVNGAPGGNLQYKAHVVEDLKKMFDTHSIAGVKMSAKLLGSSPTDNDSTEPTDDTSSESPDTSMESPKPTKKRKKKQKKSPSSPDNTMATEYSENESSPEFLTEAQASALRASYLVKPSLGDDNLSASRIGSDAEMSYGEYLVAYLNEKNARPPEERINPAHKAVLDSFLGPDEYGDIYTNISTVRTFSDEKPGLDSKAGTTVKTSKTDTASKLSAAHTLSLHGDGKCSVFCEKVFPLPYECGYFPAILPDDFDPCSLQCPGRWCKCFHK